MLTEMLYKSEETQKAMEMEISRAERTAERGKAHIASDNEVEEKVRERGIPTSVWLKVLSLAYGNTSEAKEFRVNKIYPELFRRDDEDDAPVEVFIPAQTFGLAKVRLRKGVIVKFSTTYWWEGELEGGMPFVISGVYLADKEPPKAPWAVETHTAPYIPRFNEFEDAAVSEETEGEEGEYEEYAEPSERTLKVMANVWSKIHDGDQTV